MSIQCPRCQSVMPDGAEHCEVCNYDFSRMIHAQPGPYQGQEPGAAGPRRGRRTTTCPQCGRPIRSGQPCPYCMPVQPVVNPMPQPVMNPMMQSGMQPVANQVPQPGMQPVMNPMMQSGMQPVMNQVPPPGMQPVANPMMQSGMQPVMSQVQPVPQARGFQRAMPMPSSQAVYGTGAYPTAKKPQREQRHIGAFTNISAHELIKGLSTRMGFTDPALDRRKDLFEENRLVVDTFGNEGCAGAGEGEQHVRQYRIAELRSHALGVTSAEAVGRLQVTNKRLVFRAAGKSGTYTIAAQQEANMEDIGNIEARIDRSMSGAVFARGAALALLIALAAFLVLSLCPALAKLIVVTAYTICALIVFMAVYQRWLLKSCLCAGAGFGIVCAALPFAGVNQWCMLMGLILLGCGMTALWMYALRSNLSLTVRSHEGQVLIDLNRDTLGHRHVGFDEVEPGSQAAQAVSELEAMVLDLQMLGDGAIAKWRQ